MTNICNCPDENGLFKIGCVNHQSVLTKDNWKDSYEIIWQMSADHIADEAAGCYGKMDMVKKELQAKIKEI